jgi:hypothetical protein
MLCVRAKPSNLQRQMLLKLQVKELHLSYSFLTTTTKSKGKAVPQHAMEALGGRGGIAPTHSRHRH